MGRRGVRIDKAGQWLALMWDRLTGPDHRDHLATSMDLCADPGLAALLGRRPGFFTRLRPAPHATLVGWGRRWSGRRAAAIAARHGSRLLLLEDGFLRSVGRDDPPLSYVLDDIGIHYDARTPSRFEALVSLPLSGTDAARTDRIIAAWRGNYLSKYNATPDVEGDLPGRYVLVADQVAGDLSVEGGLADAGSFARMLDAALAENPGMTVVVKLHPDTTTRRKRGYFDPAALATNPRIRIVAGDCHPTRLIAAAEAIYTVTSQLGFEALLWGRPVRCFGMPFYAGWGLTADDLPAPARRRPASLAQLVHAALVAYPRYVDPETGAETDAESAMAWAGLQRRHRQHGAIWALGFSRWKRPVLRRFLAGAGIRFVRSARRIPAGATVAVWGASDPRHLPERIRLLRIEDGFLRSSGLGADLVHPLSWVIDDEGMHYDATRPSRLERLLESGSPDSPALDRAERLIESIRNRRVSKYNLAGTPWTRPAGARSVILVPGQVESDASLRLGAPDIRTNRALVEAVRRDNPDAWIVYKPHPDVVSGLRRAGRDEAEAMMLVDEVATGPDPAGLLEQVDEVHTMTSLMGFEALIRGVPVTCWGLPFYAGWGLTRDRFACPRRTRRLTLPELVHGALVAYPTYVSRRTGAFTTPERTVEELAAWRARGPSGAGAFKSLQRAVLRLWTASGIKRNA